jgi:hypothetical protein
MRWSFGVSASRTGWGIGVVMNAWDVFWRHEITEADIQCEMGREHR